MINYSIGKWLEGGYIRGFAVTTKSQETKQGLDTREKVRNLKFLLSNKIGP